MKDIVVCEKCSATHYRGELQLVGDKLLCYACAASWTPHEAVLDELMSIVGHDGSYRDLPEIVRRLVEADDAHGRTP